MLQIAAIDRANSTLSQAPLTEQLREKSRLLRGRIERLAEASTAPPLRNDILPGLELPYVRLGELRPSARKLRKLDPAHVREVASSISLLGFVTRFLPAATTCLFTAKCALRRRSNWASIGSPAREFAHLIRVHAERHGDTDPLVVKIVNDPDDDAQKQWIKGERRHR